MTDLLDLYNLTKDSDVSVFVCDYNGEVNIELTNEMANNFVGTLYISRLDIYNGCIRAWLFADENIVHWLAEQYPPKLDVDKLVIGSKVKLDDIGSICTVGFVGDTSIRLVMNEIDIWIDRKTLKKIGKEVKEVADYE